MASYPYVLSYKTNYTKYFYRALVAYAVASKKC